MKHPPDQCTQQPPSHFEPWGTAPRFRFSRIPNLSYSMVFPQLEQRAPQHWADSGNRPLLLHALSSQCPVSGCNQHPKSPKRGIWHPRFSADTYNKLVQCVLTCLGTGLSPLEPSHTQCEFTPQPTRTGYTFANIKGELFGESSASRVWVLFFLPPFFFKLCQYQLCFSSWKLYNDERNCLFFSLKG